MGQGKGKTWVEAQPGILLMMSEVQCILRPGLNRTTLVSQLSPCTRGYTVVFAYSTLFRHWVLCCFKFLTQLAFVDDLPATKKSANFCFDKFLYFSLLPEESRTVFTSYNFALHCLANMLFLLGLSQFWSHLFELLRGNTRKGSM